MKVIIRADGRAASGGAPLVVHHERLADPLDEYTRAIAAISKKRNKTEADHLEIARLEFFGGGYWTPNLSVTASANGADGYIPIIPAWNLLRCLQDGAKRHKRGPDVLRGVYPLAEFAPLTTDDGPLAPGERWRGGLWLRKTVGVQRARTMRTRPMFTEWQVGLPVEVDMNVLDLDTLRSFWHDAGIYAGLAEMRPVYGRFAGTIEATS
jgi:hypothetical protein